MRLHVTRRLVLLLAVGALATAAVASADHTWKNHRMRQADVSTWFCVNRGVLCDKPQTTEIEDGWHHREIAYRVVFAGFAYALLASATVVVARRAPA